MTDSNSFDALRTDELLVHVREGDRNAWREVYRRYRPFLSIAANSVTGARHQDVDDVLQSAFLSAWKDIESFSYNGKNSFRAWLRGIVVHRNLNELRKRNRRGTPLDQGRMGTAWISKNRDPSALDPAEELENDEEEQRLLRCMEDHLDELEREIVILRDFEGLPVSQVAEIVELDPRTVRRRYKDAVSKLQRALDLPEA